MQIHIHTFALEDNRQICTLIAVNIRASSIGSIPQVGEKTGNSSNSIEATRRQEHVLLKKCVNRNFFTGLDSDKHTLIGDKNIGITKIGETKLKTLHRAEIHF